MLQILLLPATVAAVIALGIRSERVALVAPTEAVAALSCPEHFQTVTVHDLLRTHLANDSAFVARLDRNHDGILCISPWGELLPAPKSPATRTDNYNVFVDNHPDDVPLDPSMNVRVSTITVRDDAVGTKYLVTIYGTEAFDVAALDVSQLRFGPGNAVPLCTTMGHLEDVDGDGLTDLVSCYGAAEVAAFKALKAGTLCLQGQTVGGVEIWGCYGPPTPKGKRDKS
jgi:hypothetical protein